MDNDTRQRAHQKLNAIKDYIGYPEEILVNSNLEELYKGLEISSTNYFPNRINMSIWSRNYHWKKLREKVIFFVYNRPNLSKNLNGQVFDSNGIRISSSLTLFQVDKTDWKRHAKPALVNAFYRAIENSITFPAGILQVRLIGWYHYLYLLQFTIFYFQTRRN